MKNQKVFIEPGTTATIAIPYEEGYMLRINPDAGILHLYRVKGNKLKPLVTHLLRYEEEKEL